MHIEVGNILEMKKAHPCGAVRWRVLRTGADIRMCCLGCGHEVMRPRSIVERSIRSVLTENPENSESASSN